MNGTWGGAARSWWVSGCEGGRAIRGGGLQLVRLFPPGGVGEEGAGDVGDCHRFEGGEGERLDAAADALDDEPEDLAAGDGFEHVVGFAAVVDVVGGDPGEDDGVFGELYCVEGAASGESR